MTPEELKTNQALVALFKQAAAAGCTDLLVKHGLNVTAHPAWLNLQENFITLDPQCKQLFRHVVFLCSVPDPVIIYGESGTGKELIARALGIDCTADKFKALNVTSLPDYLVESELFGHKRGAFTGAVEDKEGLLEAAKVVFLDEIGDLPLTVQPKLLRAVQERMVRRVGDNVERSIQCRFICATHRQLPLLVKRWEETDGKEGFRPDLYWRLAVHELHIPPLRERVCDIVALVKHFSGGQIDPEPYTKMELRGNVRELLTLIKREQLRRKMM